jgi:hypothetical protein
VRTRPPSRRLLRRREPSLRPMMSACLSKG